MDVASRRDPRPAILLRESHRQLATVRFVEEDVPALEDPIVLGGISLIECVVAQDAGNGRFVVEVINRVLADWSGSARFHRPRCKGVATAKAKLQGMMSLENKCPRDARVCDVHGQNHRSQIHCSRERRRGMGRLRYYVDHRSVDKDFLLCVVA